MGLKTRESSAIAYDKGNSLAENAVGRVRPLACSLMHQLHGRLGVQLQTSSAIWSWALRHAAWLISRFSVIRGATAYELAFGRVFTGELCEGSCNVEEDVVFGESRVFHGSTSLVLERGFCQQ